MRYARKRQSRPDVVREPEAKHEIVDARHIVQRTDKLLARGDKGDALSDRHARGPQQQRAPRRNQQALDAEQARFGRTDVQRLAATDDDGHVVERIARQAAEELVKSARRGNQNEVARTCQLAHVELGGDADFLLGETGEGKAANYASQNNAWAKHEDWCVRKNTQKVNAVRLSIDR